jgi:2-methylcitrate dehydratase
MTSQTKKSAPDLVLRQIAEYVTGYRVTSQAAYTMARCCLLDSIACGLNALEYPECTKLLGPTVPGASLPNGARVPGTRYSLEPVKAAFDISSAIRWLEHSDTWFGLDGGHPSDNLGAVLAVADYVSRNAAARRKRALTVGDVLTALIKVYEIQGVLYLKTNFIDIGLDSVGLVTVASSAVATRMLGGGRDQIINAVSNAFLDGANPRHYRIGSSAGWRMKWAAGDAAARGVMHALMALRGEVGFPNALTAPRWGFADTLMHGKPVELARPLGTFVVENVLFKIPFPAHFHAQSASECALRLHALVKDRIGDIKSVHLRTHEKTVKSASREGPLKDPASRDHCVQYVVAYVLIHGKLAARDYDNKAAADPRIDRLRAKMIVKEDVSFTRDFYDARKRTNCNALYVEFRDGTRTPEVRIDYPVGHPKRRKEGLPIVEQKFRDSLKQIFSVRRQDKIMAACSNLQDLKKVPFKDFMALFVP